MVQVNTKQIHKRLEKEQNHLAINEHLLWIWEIIIDLLVEYIEDDI
jgi:hypothetical protein